MKRLFICVVGLVIAVTAWSRTFNMKELGADPRGIESCTELINQTIEKASSEGGGTIYFPAGVYLTATIHMKSNITLYVESGAVLRFSDRFEDYLPFVKIRWEGTVMNTLSPLIYAHDAENLTITGRGTLDGNGFKWWSWEKETRELIKKNGGKLPALNKLQRMWEEANEDLEISDYYKPSLERRMFRPPFIQFYECNNVLIENVKIVNSPFWTINPAFCDNVTVHGVTIYNPSKDPKGPNTDGINPSSCRNVRISDCFISVGDDCITIKSGRDADGREILDVFAQKKLTCQIEQVDYPTGTVQVTLDAVGVPCYEIKEGVAWDNIPFTDDLKRLALSTRAVCFGSLAQRSPVSRATIQRFLDTMPDGEDQIKIFDINLRQGFYTKEILCESMRRCNILKINDEELVTISRIFGYPGIDLQDKCWILLAKYNLKMLILTCGTNGSYVFTPGVVSYQDTPKVPVADTVGAGDSFTAAFTSAILSGKSVPEAHKLAVEVSAYVCTQSGAMPELPYAFKSRLE